MYLSVQQIGAGVGAVILVLIPVFAVTTISVIRGSYKRLSEGQSSMAQALAVLVAQVEPETFSRRIMSLESSLALLNQRIEEEHQRRLEHERRHGEAR